MKKREVLFSVAPGTRCYVVAVDAGGVGCGFIEKKAMARSSIATQTRRAPMTTIVRIAPISNRSPVVPKSPTPVFVAMIL